MRLIVKVIVVLAALLFMVMTGMSNPDQVTFRLTPLGLTSGMIPAALMYFICFAVGVIAGAVLAMGSGSKKAASSSSSKDK
jgi:MFS superfamily sulfate permease-like transporter